MYIRISDLELRSIISIIELDSIKVAGSSSTHKNVIYIFILEVTANICQRVLARFKYNFSRLASFDVSPVWREEQGGWWSGCLTSRHM